MFLKDKIAIQVNRIYNNIYQEPEFITGSDEKINQLLKDYQDNTNHFEQETMFNDMLSGQPQLTITLGRFGFVPNKDIPIVAIVRYDFISPATKKNSSSFPWGIIKLTLILALLIPVLWSFLMAYTAQKVADGMNKLDEISNECIVTTKNGKPYTIKMYGETLFYDNNNEIILPDLREVLPQEQEAYEYPFQYCKILALDGKEPII
jgi:hypothetical protein